MSNILITGGTGTLGKALSKLLAEKGIEHSIASRNKPPNAANWVPIDLLKNTGVAAAVKDKNIIVHLAHDLKRENECTQNLLDNITIKTAVRFIYISIVGIDAVPIDYYGQKLLSEKMIIESGTPYSILRATQFHEFVDKNLAAVMKFPVVTLPKKMLVQPVQTEVVAQGLATLLQQPATNRIDYVGGLKTHSLSELIQSWQKASHNHSVVFNLPLWGKLGSALNSGKLTLPNSNLQSMSWEDWLAKKYS